MGLNGRAYWASAMKMWSGFGNCAVVVLLDLVDKKWWNRTSMIKDGRCFEYSSHKCTPSEFEQ